MIPITAALAIAEATGLTGWIGKKLGGDVGEKTAEKISQIAQVATGVATPEEALAVIKTDPTVAEKVKEKILDQEHEITMAHIQDVKDARDMYEKTDHTMADKVVDSIMKYNMLFIMILVIGLVGLNFIPGVTPAIATMLATVAGGVITKLLDERSQVTGFFLGSSKSSKDKTDKINKMFK